MAGTNKAAQGRSTTGARSCTTGRPAVEYSQAGTGLYTVAGIRRAGGKGMAFKVLNVIDGVTFEVLPPWKWNDQSGIRVRPSGYKIPEPGQPGCREAKDKLRHLILGKEVELKNFAGIDYDCLVCDVFIEGKNLAEHFSEYRN